MKQLFTFKTMVAVESNAILAIDNHHLAMDHSDLRAESALFKGISCNAIVLNACHP